MTKNNFFKKILYLYILFFASICNAQISYNGSFEYIGNNNKPLEWFYQLSPNYNVSVDTLAAFKGNKSLHVTSNENTSKLSSLAIYQTINLSAFKNIRSLKVVYRINFKKGNTSSLNSFFSPRECDIKKSFKKVINWNNTEFEGWKLLQAEIIDTLNCKMLYVGFVVEGIVDLNIDDIEIFVNEEKINDLPSKIPLLIVPQAKELAGLKIKL